MIRLTENKIAVVPIPDPDFTDAQQVILSDEELRYVGLDPNSVNSTVSILKPDVAKERTDQGIVKYVGPKCKDIAIGDYVLFGGYTGTTIHLEGEGSLIIFREDFAVCKIDPPDTDVNGLYFLGSDGTYFTATYEMAMEIIAQSFKNHPFRKNLKITNKEDSRDKLSD